MQRGWCISSLNLVVFFNDTFHVRNLSRCSLSLPNHLLISSVPNQTRVLFQIVHCCVSCFIFQFRHPPLVFFFPVVDFKLYTVNALTKDSGNLFGSKYVREQC